MIDHERLWSGLTGKDIVKISDIHYLKNGVYSAKSTLFTNWFLFPIKLGRYRIWFLQMYEKLKNADFLDIPFKFELISLGENSVYIVCQTLVWKIRRIWKLFRTYIKRVYFWSVLIDFDCEGNTYAVKISW